MSATLIASGGAFLASLLVQRFPILSFALLSIAVAGVYALLGPFWVLPAETLPPKVVATAMGLINSIGNLGGYFGPVVVGYFLKRSGGFIYGFGLLGIALLVGAALGFLLHPAETKVARPGCEFVNSPGAEFEGPKANATKSVSGNPMDAIG